MERRRESGNNQLPDLPGYQEAELPRIFGEGGYDPKHHEMWLVQLPIDWTYTEKLSMHMREGPNNGASFEGAEDQFGRPYMVRSEAASFVKGVYALDPGPPGGPGTPKLIPLQRRVTITRQKAVKKDAEAPLELASVPITSSAVPTASLGSAPDQGTRTLVLDSIPVSAAPEGPRSPGSTSSKDKAKKKRLKRNTAEMANLEEAVLRQANPEVGTAEQGAGTLREPERDHSASQPHGRGSRDQHGGQRGEKRPRKSKGNKTEEGAEMESSQRSGRGPERDQFGGMEGLMGSSAAEGASVEGARTEKGVVGGLGEGGEGWEAVGEARKKEKKEKKHKKEKRKRKEGEMS